MTVKPWGNVSLSYDGNDTEKLFDNFLWKHCISGWWLWVLWTHRSTGHTTVPSPRSSITNNVKRRLNIWNVGLTSVFFSFLVPPKIYDISSDITVNEGSNVSLICTASGKPEPAIFWRHITPLGEFTSPFTSLMLMKGRWVNTVADRGGMKRQVLQMK